MLLRNVGRRGVAISGHVIGSIGEAGRKWEIGLEREGEVWVVVVTVMVASSRMWVPSASSHGRSWGVVEEVSEGSVRLAALFWLGWLLVWSMGATTTGAAAGTTTLGASRSGMATTMAGGGSAIAVVGEEEKGE